MKKNTTKILVITLILVLGYSSSLFAQKLLQKQTEQVKTLNEQRREFDEKWDKFDVKNGFYMENGIKTKAPGWKLFKRAEYFWEQRVDLNTGEFPKTTAVEEFEKVKNTLKKSEDFSSSWQNLGTNTSAGGYAGIGRINCIAFDPGDASTIWVGSPSGGLWKSEDGGDTWAIKNSTLSVLGVSAIVIDKNNTNTMYIATGDRDGGSLYTLSGGQGADNASIGIYKSVNGGSTWAPTALTYTISQKVKVFDLIMHPTDPLTLLASTSTGIHKTINGGVSWTNTDSDPCWRIAYHPTNSSIVYGIETYTGQQYFQRSEDGGDTWPNDFAITESSTDAGRSELAVSAAEPNNVYLVTSNKVNRSLEGVYKSENSGGSFSKVFTPTTVNLLGYDYTGSDLTAGQGSYDLCIAANPTVAGEIYVGGVNTWKSTDGGQNWSVVTVWSNSANQVPGSDPVVYYNPLAKVIHADKHALAFQSGTVLWEGNDGGIYKVTKSGSSDTYTDKSNGLVISQIYRIGVSQTSASTILAGLQDNGSKKYIGGVNTWVDVTGGDGMECIVDYSNANYMYGTYVQGAITRTIDGFTDPNFDGQTYDEVTISDNITGNHTGAWVTPYVIHPTAPATLYAGYDQVWKTVDRGDNWTNASSGLSSTNLLRSLAIAPSNGNVLYAADQTKMWKTTNGGGSWTEITANLPSLSNMITYIAIHATNPNIVWFTVGGFTAGQKVYQSADGGGTWTPIATGLPNLPIMSIVHYKKATDRNVLFVSTDLGVYVSEQALPAAPSILPKVNVSDWSLYSNGLPNVVVSELEIFYAASGGTDKLRAGTFGRGLWETSIDAALPVELTSFAANSVEGNKVSLVWETATEVNNYGFDIERQSVVELGKTSKLSEENWKSIGFLNGSGNSNSPKKYSFVDELISGGSNFAYRLKQIDIDGSYEYSDVVEIKVVPTNFTLQQNYPNPFNPETKINYSVPSKTQITLSVFDVLGREIVKLVNEIQEQGVYEATFDASQFPSGIYFYSLQAGEFTQTRKMMLLK